MKLINQNMSKAPLIMFAYGRVSLQQLVGTQQQFREIDYTIALALRLVQLIYLN